MSIDSEDHRALFCRNSTAWYRRICFRAQLIQAAYDSFLTLANIAVRANGFRVSLGQGHHQRVIESVEHTLTTQDAAAREKWVEEKRQKLRLGRRRLAHQPRADHQRPHVLRELVRTWLREAHPELLKNDSKQN